MKVLLVNKFLYPKGGAETYTFKLGETLVEKGHTVEYFGLENSKNVVGNTIGAYAVDIDFNKKSVKNLFAPFRIIYSLGAKKKIAKVLKDFKPDVVHLNNIHFHLTPSIIIAVENYRKKVNPNLKIIYTAHDYQLICPSHGLFDVNLKVCEKCLGGNYTHCFKSKCVKNSYLKSLIATIDAYFWKHNKAYNFIDTIICPSNFLKSKLDTSQRFANKTVVIHNFIEPQPFNKANKENYVLEFGHLSYDKGTLTLLEVAKRMPETRFVFAGYGSAVEKIAEVANAEYVGFKTGKELTDLISSALCSVYPSRWYENCPFSVIESQMCGTPVICSNMGGIPELINDGQTGLLFEAGNSDHLEMQVRSLLENKNLLEKFSENCRSVVFETPKTYYDKLKKLYGE